MESVSGLTGLTGAIVLILGPQRCAGVDGWPWHCEFFRDVTSPTCVKGKEEMFSTWVSQRMRQNWTGWRSSFLLQGRQNVPRASHRFIARRWDMVQETEVLQQFCNIQCLSHLQWHQSTYCLVLGMQGSLHHCWHFTSEDFRNIPNLSLSSSLFQDQALPPVPAAHRHPKSLCGLW